MGQCTGALGSRQLLEAIAWLGIQIFFIKNFKLQVLRVLSNLGWEPIPTAGKGISRRSRMFWYLKDFLLYCCLSLCRQEATHFIRWVRWAENLVDMCNNELYTVENNAYKKLENVIV